MMRWSIGVILVLALANQGKSQDYLDRVWILGSWYLAGEPTSNLFEFTNDTFYQSPLFFPWGNLLDGTIAVANKEGPALWAFSNGCKMFNRNLELMMNGDSIVAGVLYKTQCKANSSSSPYTNGAVLIPWPGTKDSILLFNLNLEQIYDDNGLNVGPSLLHYSVIDMSLDEGYGSVIEKRLTAIDDKLGRNSVLAVRHSNGEDWWIVVPRSRSACYFSVPVTKEGVGTPVYTCTEKLWGDFDLIGQATFSPDRNRYARIIAEEGLHIYQFDASTGQMVWEFGLDFPGEPLVYTGVAFSPSGRYIYATYDYKIWQFDLEAPDVSASRVLVAERDPDFADPFHTRFYSAVLAPDGRIYISPSGQYNYLQVILEPDCPGSSCQVMQNHIKIYGSGRNSLPNLPFFRDWSGYNGCETSSTDQSDILQNDYKIFPNPVSDYLQLSRSNLEPGATCNVFDMNGRLVMSRPLGEAYNVSMNMLQLPAGMYGIQLVDDKGLVHYRDKFMKLGF